MSSISRQWCIKPALIFCRQIRDPQQNSQATGFGFPLAKIGVFFSIATGAAIALVIDVFNTHDIKLARKLYQFLFPVDVLLGDREFCAYADLVFIKNRGCDAVVRTHQARLPQMKKGKRIGPSDQIITWQKPKTRPLGVSMEEFSALPKT